LFNFDISLHTIPEDYIKQRRAYY